MHEGHFHYCCWSTAFLVWHRRLAFLLLPSAECQPQCNGQPAMQPSSGGSVDGRRLFQPPRHQLLRRCQSNFRTNSLLSSCSMTRLQQGGNQHWIGPRGHPCRWALRRPYPSLSHTHFTAGQPLFFSYHESLGREVASFPSPPLPLCRRLLSCNQLRCCRLFACLSLFCLRLRCCFSCSATLINSYAAALGLLAHPSISVDKLYLWAARGGRWEEEEGHRRTK
jgi:hypothetical protein